MTPSQNNPTASRDPAKAPVTITSRADLRDLLIASGLARGAADKVARAGWAALSGEITETDLIEEVASAAETLAEIFKDIRT